MDVSPQTSNLYEQAIDAALNSRWEEALSINKKILKLDPQNVDALNRQAKAYMELGRYNLAKKYYSEVLTFDPYNPIAQKNLKIMKSFKTSKLYSNGKADQSCPLTKLSPALFLQEPGKTKMVNLLKVAEPQKLSQAYCGMRVEMVIKNRRIMIVDAEGNYLGVLPDDLSHQLCRLTKGGNKYESFIKAISVNSLSVIIKETFRSKRFKNQPSFLEFSQSTNITNSLTPLETLTAEEETEETQEENL
ncbi:tetratricopeptide repeat protein [Candidatus Daviesbacteria bacterium]|nr:tetratricopeptide repeat protein [Candidatus Daviesbacteria bacterium]